MFIKEITLEKFRNIKTGLNADRLFIDFSTQKNPVCVISGPNGIGKTSLLSYLTPFATLGNLDVRESNKLILENEKGYKKIVLVDDERNLYEIEHFYTPSDDTFTIKSYFKVNEEELNANGNVSSFKELVAEYLDLEIGYLKLIRMGDNVQNLIKSKATERKTFMGKILDSVDYYLKKHKEISQKERDTRLIITHIVDELKKTDIENPKDADRQLKNFDEKIELQSSHLQSLEEKRTKILYEIEELDFPEDGNHLIKELEKSTEKYAKRLGEIDLSKITVDGLNGILDKEKKELLTIQSSYESTSNTHSHLIEELDYNFESLHNIESQIQKEKEELNLDSLKEYQISLQKKLNESYRTSFDERHIDCTKEEFDEFVVFLKNTQKLLNVTYEYGKEPIREVLKGMRKNEDIQNLILASLVAVESKERAERMSIIDRLISRYSMEVNCKEECPYKNLHRELMEIRDARPVNEVKHTSEFYQMMKLAHDNLSSIFASFNERKKFIQRLPIDIQEMFLVDNLFKRISDSEIIYNEPLLNEYMDFLTESANYRKLEKEMEDLKAEIKRVESVSRLEFLEKEKKRINEKIEEIKEKMEEAKESMVELRLKEGKLRESIELSETTLFALTDYDTEMEKLTSLREKKERISVLQRELVSLEISISSDKRAKEDLVRERYQKEANLANYKRLTRELEEKRLLYEDYQNLRFALSNKTGIPLVFIEEYLKETNEIANKLLDIVYDGSLYLDDFKITADEFKMPYVKNGRKIDDVSTASQGEQSFFNMAISSALRAQSIKRYNIGLFDEVDSMFDDSNRQRFIPVLEKQLELNRIRQAFLITHNLMFKQYPVDLIDLGDISNSTVHIELG